MAYRKYGNKRVTIGDKKFASKKEGKRYIDLCLLQRSGAIFGLKTQVHYPIHINGMLVCKYIADFVYYNKKGSKVVEDTKGYRTTEYKLKKKLMLAVHGIEILET